MSKESTGKRLTDELRDKIKSAERFYGREFKCLTAIADRIDEAHQKAITSVMNDALYHANDKDMAYLGWVRPPKDADGEYWFCGDKTMLPDGNVVEVIGIGGDWLYYCVASAAITVFGRIRAHDSRHYKQPTVEDTLHSFICDIEEGVRIEDDIIAEYAAKLRLAGDAE